MNWTKFVKSVRRLTHRYPSSPPSHRPMLDTLEDRTVLSPVSFHIVQNQSPLTLSGTIGGADIQEQGPGSLTTTYFGDFLGDVDEANGAINFIGTGNDFCAANTGNWAPMPDGSGGTAPAEYGFQADLSGPFLGALRDFHLRIDTFGNAIGLYQNDDGSFGFSSAQIITINAGSGTYSHPDLGSGPINFSGLNGQNQAADGTFYDNGDGTVAVVIPISVSVSGSLAGLDYNLSIDGTGVGVGNFTGPRPSGHQRLDHTLGTAMNSESHSVANSLVPNDTLSLPLAPVTMPSGVLTATNVATEQNSGIAEISPLVAHHVNAVPSIDPLLATFSLPGL